jgi:hypothetical protein
VQGFVQLLRHFHHAEVASVGMVAFLVDVEEGDAGFEGGVLVAASGNQHVGLGLGDYLEQFLGVALLQHDAVFAQQVFDPGFVFGGALFGAGGGDINAQILGRRDDRPAFDAAGIEHNRLPCRR